MRVLHVTESLASGVLSALGVLLTEQSRSGAEVTLLHTRHAETPPPRELTSYFPREIRRIERRASRVQPAPLSLLAAMTDQLDDGFDVVHAHSSWAGLIVRSLAMRRRRRTQPHIWYSPHAYAFLRTDISSGTRRMLREVERRLSAVGSIAAVSESEAQLASDLAPSADVHVLTNRIHVEELPIRRRVSTGHRRPIVAGLGRPAPQKAPERFAEIARRLGSQADFVWIGASKADGGYFRGSPVELISWSSRRAALEQLADADIFLSTSEWEGLPLGLIEAQALGLPAVVTDVPGNRDVVQDRVTGYVCKSVTDVQTQVSLLLQDAELYGQLSINSRSSARERYGVGSLGAESLDMYCEALR